jgi:uncharacterized membrane-anchored protein YitT (DUF2179 family)
MVTAGMNFKMKSPNQASEFRYLTAAVFGIIHGMGFSSFFRMISSEGDTFITQLLLFNLGVEVGQLLIVAAILSIIALTALAIPSSHGRQSKVLSGISFLLALALAIEKYPG